MASRRQVRYQWLRASHLTPREARMLSELPKSTPALRELVADRLARWERFARIAAAKINRGKWRERDVPGKWLANLGRMYYKRGWLVKQGPKGKQQKQTKGMPNPWALYRVYEKQYPGKGYVSPWEVKQVKRGNKKGFDRGQIFIQKAEKGAQRGTIERWIEQLDESIKMYPAQRAQFEKQQERLRRML